MSRPEGKLGSPDAKAIWQVRAIASSCIRSSFGDERTGRDGGSGQGGRDLMKRGICSTRDLDLNRRHISSSRHWQIGVSWLAPELQAPSSSRIDLEVADPEIHSQVVVQLVLKMSRVSFQTRQNTVQLQAAGIKLEYSLMTPNALVSSQQQQAGSDSSHFDSVSRLAICLHPWSWLGGCMTDP